LPLASANRAATFIMKGLLAKHRLTRFDVPGALGDIVIVFVNDNPALLEIAEPGSLALDLRNLKRKPPGLPAAAAW